MLQRKPDPGDDGGEWIEIPLNHRLVALILLLPPIASIVIAGTGYACAYLTSQQTLFASIALTIILTVFAWSTILAGKPVRICREGVRLPTGEFWGWADIESLTVVCYHGTFILELRSGRIGDVEQIPAIFLGKEWRLIIEFFQKHRISGEATGENESAPR